MDSHSIPYSTDLHCYNLLLVNPASETGGIIQSNILPQLVGRDVPPEVTGNDGQAGFADLLLAIADEQHSKIIIYRMYYLETQLEWQTI